MIEKNFILNILRINKLSIKKELNRRYIYYLYNIRVENNELWVEAYEI